MLAVTKSPAMLQTSTANCIYVLLITRMSGDVAEKYNPSHSGAKCPRAACLYFGIPNSRVISDLYPTVTIMHVVMN